MEDKEKMKMLQIQILKVPNPKIVCRFCKRSEIDEKKFGPFYKSGKFVLHYFCMAFSSGLSQQRGHYAKGILGFNPEHLQTDIYRSCRLKCCFCEKRGAATTCGQPHCERHMHFPCALENRVPIRFMGQFVARCDQHRRPRPRPGDVKPDSWWLWRTEPHDFSKLFRAQAKKIAANWEVPTEDDRWDIPCPAILRRLGLRPKTQGGRISKLKPLVIFNSKENIVTKTELVARARYPQFFNRCPIVMLERRLSRDFIDPAGQESSEDESSSAEDEVSQLGNSSKGADIVEIVYDKCVNSNNVNNLEIVKSVTTTTTTGGRKSVQSGEDSTRYALWVSAYATNVNPLDRSAEYANWVSDYAKNVNSAEHENLASDVGGSVRTVENSIDLESDVGENGKPIEHSIESDNLLTDLRKDLDSVEAFTEQENLVSDINANVKYIEHSESDHEKHVKSVEDSIERDSLLSDLRQDMDSLEVSNEEEKLVSDINANVKSFEDSESHHEKYVKSVENSIQRDNFLSDLRNDIGSDEDLIEFENLLSDLGGNRNSPEYYNNLVSDLLEDVDSVEDFTEHEDLLSDLRREPNSAGSESDVGENLESVQNSTEHDYLVSDMLEDVESDEDFSEHDNLVSDLGTNDKSVENSTTYTHPEANYEGNENSTEHSTIYEITMPDFTKNVYLEDPNQNMCTYYEKDGSTIEGSIERLVSDLVETVDSVEDSIEHEDSMRNHTENVEPIENSTDYQHSKSDYVGNGNSIEDSTYHQNLVSDLAENVNSTQDSSKSSNSKSSFAENYKELEDQNKSSAAVANIQSQPEICMVENENDDEESIQDSTESANNGENVKLIIDSAKPSLMEGENSTKYENSKPTSSLLEKHDDECAELEGIQSESETDLVVNEGEPSQNGEYVIDSTKSLSSTSTYGNNVIENSSKTKASSLEIEVSNSMSTFPENHKDERLGPEVTFSEFSESESKIDVLENEVDSSENSESVDDSAQSVNYGENVKLIENSPKATSLEFEFPYSKSTFPDNHKDKSFGCVDAEVTLSESVSNIDLLEIEVDSPEISESVDDSAQFANYDKNVKFIENSSKAASLEFEFSNSKSTFAENHEDESFGYEDAEVTVAQSESRIDLLENEVDSSESTESIEDSTKSPSSMSNHEVIVKLIENSSKATNSESAFPENHQNESFIGASVELTVSESESRIDLLENEVDSSENRESIEDSRKSPRSMSKHEEIVKLIENSSQASDAKTAFPENHENESFIGSSVEVTVIDLVQNKMDFDSKTISETEESESDLRVLSPFLPSPAPTPSGHCLGAVGETPGIQFPVSNSIESKSVPAATVKMGKDKRKKRKKSTEKITDQMTDADDESTRDGSFTEKEVSESPPPTLLLPSTLSLFAKQQLKEKAEKKKKWSVPTNGNMDKDSNSSGDSEPDPNIPSRRQIPDRVVSKLPAVSEEELKELGSGNTDDSGDNAEDYLTPTNSTDLDRPSSLELKVKSGGSMSQKIFSPITMLSLSRALASVKTKINNEPVPGFSGNLMGDPAAATRALISSFDFKSTTQEIQPDSVSGFDFDLELGLAYVSPEIEPDEIDANVAVCTEISTIPESDSEYEADFQPASIVGLESNVLSGQVEPNEIEKTVVSTERTSPNPLLLESCVAPPVLENGPNDISGIVSSPLPESDFQTVEMESASALPNGVPQEDVESREICKDVDTKGASPLTIPVTELQNVVSDAANVTKELVPIAPLTSEIIPTKTQTSPCKSQTRKAKPTDSEIKSMGLDYWVSDLEDSNDGVKVPGSGQIGGGTPANNETNALEKTLSPCSSRSSGDDETKSRKLFKKSPAGVLKPLEQGSVFWGIDALVKHYRDDPILGPIRSEQGNHDIEVNGNGPETNLATQIELEQPGYLGVEEEEQQFSSQLMFSSQFESQGMEFVPEVVVESNAGYNESGQIGIGAGHVETQRPSVSSVSLTGSKKDDAEHSAIVAEMESMHQEFLSPKSNGKSRRNERIEYSVPTPVNSQEMEPSEMEVEVVNNEDWFQESNDISGSGNGARKSKRARTPKSESKSNGLGVEPNKSCDLMGSGTGTRKSTRARASTMNENFEYEAHGSPGSGINTPKSTRRASTSAVRNLRSDQNIEPNNGIPQESEVLDYQNASANLNEPSASPISTRKSTRIRVSTPKASNESNQITELNRISRKLELLTDVDVGEKTSSKLNETTGSGIGTRKSTRARASTPKAAGLNQNEDIELSGIPEVPKEVDDDGEKLSLKSNETSELRIGTRKSTRSRASTPKASGLKQNKNIELSGIPAVPAVEDDDDEKLPLKSNEASELEIGGRKLTRALSLTFTSKASSMQSTKVVELNKIPEEFESVAHDDINLSSKSNNSSRSSFSTRKSKQAPSSTSKASSMQSTEVLELNGISDAHDDKILSSKSNDSSKSSFSTRKSKRTPSLTSMASGLSPNKKICMNNSGIAAESDVIMVKNKSSSKSSEVSGSGIGVRKLKRTPPSKSAESSSKSLSKRSRLERIVNGTSMESEIGNEEDLSTESSGTSGSKQFGFKPRTSVNSNVSISSLKSSGSESVIILSEDISIPPVNKTGNKSETTKRGFSSSSDESSTLKRLKPRWLVESGARDYFARMSRNTTREEAEEIWEKQKLEEERKRKMAEENASTPPITFGYTGPSVPAGPSGPKIFGDRSWEKPVLYANNGPRGIFPIYDPWEAMMDRVGDIVEMTRCPWLIDSATGKRFDPNNC